MRILALDLGDKRIGVAISDEMGWTARGITFIKRTNLEKDLTAIEQVMKEYESVGEIVVGMPFNMDGTEGERVHVTREFINHLSKKFSLPIVEVDERLTTYEAEKILIAADLSRKKRKLKVDQLAAQLILQTYLESRSKSP